MSKLRTWWRQVKTNVEREFGREVAKAVFGELKVGPCMDRYMQLNQSVQKHLSKALKAQGSKRDLRAVHRIWERYTKEGSKLQEKLHETFRLLAPLSNARNKQEVIRPLKQLFESIAEEHDRRAADYRLLAESVGWRERYGTDGSTPDKHHRLRGPGIGRSEGRDWWWERAQVDQSTGVEIEGFRGVHRRKGGFLMGNAHRRQQHRGLTQEELRILGEMIVSDAEQHPILVEYGKQLEHGIPMPSPAYMRANGMYKVSEAARKRKQDHDCLVSTGMRLDAWRAWSAKNEREAQEKKAQEERQKRERAAMQWVDHQLGMTPDQLQALNWVQKQLRKYPS